MNSTIHGILRNILWGALLIFASCRKPNSDKERITICFYNVENLFDATNDPGKHDDEYTNSSPKKWNEKKYRNKISKLSDVIASVKTFGFPDIVGLCEIENRNVLSDLIHAGKLKNSHYSIIHFEGGDIRGIENAIIYRNKNLKPVSSQPLPVMAKGEKRFISRDILYAVFDTGRDKLHVLLNHWPSRNDGNEESEYKRGEIARILKQKTDEILESDPWANIILLGDFNDEPDSNSLKNILKAGSPEDKNSKLVNLMYPEFREGRGSYYFQRDWSMLDNIIVSQSLVDGAGLDCWDKRGFILRERWMCYQNPVGEYVPDRTYIGNDYKGGISDHFPVYFHISD
jgi:predicted extracellular nuclease